MPETRFEVAKVLFDHIEGEGGYGCSRLAEKVDCNPRTIQRWCANETRPYADELLKVVAAIQEDDPARASSLWRALSALVFQESRPAPRAELAGDVEDGCLAVSEEAGDVTRALRKARDPRSAGGVEITPGEAAEIAEEARDVERAAVGLHAAARSVPSPQLALASGVR
jgi:hypothetical protein